MSRESVGWPLSFVLASCVYSLSPSAWRASRFETAASSGVLAQMTMPVRRAVYITSCRGEEDALTGRSSFDLIAFVYSIAHTSFFLRRREKYRIRTADVGCVRVHTFVGAREAAAALSVTRALFNNVGPT